MNTDLIATTDLKDEQWKLRANCQGIDTEMFFVDAGSNMDITLKKVCERCEVRQECLDYAIKYNMEGLWAGMGQKARQKIKLSRQKSTSHRG